MGLFDNLKLVKDLVKGGIEAVKATDQLDALVETSQTTYASRLSPRNKKFYKDFKALKDKQDGLEDIDAANAMMDEVEGAEVDYLLSLLMNKSLPKEFHSEITQAVEEYHKANNAPYEILEKRFLKMARTEEERQFVNQMMEEVKKDES